MPDNRKFDGQLSFEAGVDSGRSPTLIDQNQLAWGMNITCRGGFVTHRPGIVRRRMNFQSDGIQELFSTGYFQGSEVYEGDNCSVSLIASISGRLFKVDMSFGLSVTEISIPGDLGAASVPHVWFQQAEKFMIIQDNANVPIIFDGATSRRSVVANHEVPTGTAMTYGKGRLWVAIGKSYVGGDLVGADGTADSVIKFTENEFFNEGGSFFVPSQQGDCAPITAMAFGSNLDTAFGTGDLLVFTQGSIFAFDAPVDRTTWKNLSYPIQRFALLDYGAMGNDSVCTVNGDLFFRSQDGIRSFIFARRDFTQSWANTPISNEVQRAIQYDDQSLLYASSACNFDNRLLMTVGPERHERGVIHRGLTALDFDLVSGMRNKLPPAWEGVWTGVRVLKIHRFRLNGKQVCFVFGVDDTDTIGLWEITVAERFDNGSTPIRWSFESRNFNYGNTPMAKKRLLHNEMWIDNVVGDIAIQRRFKSDTRSCWEQWDLYETCSDKGSCQTEPDFCELRPSQPAIRNRITSPEAPNECREDGDPVAIGYTHQLRCEMSGSFTVKGFRVVADPVPEDMAGNIDCS